MVDESEVLILSQLGVDGSTQLVITKLILIDRVRVLNAVLDLLEGVDDLKQLQEVRERLINALEAARSMRDELPNLDLVMRSLGGEA